MNNQENPKDYYNYKMQSHKPLPHSPGIIGQSSSSQCSIRVSTRPSLDPFMLKRKFREHRCTSNVSNRSHQIAVFSKFPDEKNLIKTQSNLTESTDNKAECSKLPVEEEDPLEIINYYTNLNNQRKEKHMREKRIEKFTKIFGLEYVGDNLVEAAFNRMENMSTQDLEDLVYGRGLVGYRDSKLNRGLPPASFKKYLEMRLQRESLLNSQKRPVSNVSNSTYEITECSKFLNKKMEPLKTPRSRHSTTKIIETSKEKILKKSQSNVSHRTYKKVRFSNNVAQFNTLDNNCEVRNMKETDFEREDVKLARNQSNLVKSKEMQMEEFRELFDLPYVGDVLLEQVFDKMENMSMQDLKKVCHGDGTVNDDLPLDGFKTYLEMRLQRESLLDSSKDTKN